MAKQIEIKVTESKSKAPFVVRIVKGERLGFTTADAAVDFATAELKGMLDEGVHGSSDEGDGR